MDDLVDLRSTRSVEDDPEVIELAPGETSLDFFRKIYHSPRQPMARRMRAAEFALQFEHPKLGAIAYGYMNGESFAAKLERAIERSGRAQVVRQIELQAEAGAGEAEG